MRQTGETFLGDGLYASWDGTYVCLRAPRTDGDHVVYVDCQTFASLMEFLAETQIFNVCGGRNHVQ